jgi:hypothetical protein
MISKFLKENHFIFALLKSWRFIRLFVDMKENLIQKKNSDEQNHASKGEQTT